MSKKTVYSNIAIDLGGKYTGCVSYTSSILPSADDFNAFIIEMPDDGNGIKYTVKDRTQKRHMVRSLDRFKKARKLIYLVTASIIRRELSSDEKEAISSLMKRRGYTRLEAEIDLDILKECPVDLFTLYLNDLFDENQSLYDQFNQKCCDLDTAKAMKKALASEELSIALKSSDLGKTEKTLYKSAFNTMVEAADNIINTCEFGNKHRKQYLSDIRFDINKDSRLTDIVNGLGNSEKLYRCIGNISNLQLRALRWYFNDISMKGNPKWIPEKFKKVWVRAYKYFHYPKEDQLKARALIDNLESIEDATSLLFSIDPLDTIPPYEDQNNRNPPTDLTLLLSPKALDARYSKVWENWAEKFASLYPNLTYQLEDIVKNTDRKSRIELKNSNSYTKSKVLHSYILQRLFDLSANKDEPVTLLRSWVKDPSNSKLLSTAKIIHSVVGEREDDFYKLAQSYYNEVEMAKSGLWTVVESPLLEISEIHPPMKNKVISTLVGNVLGINNDFDYEKFLEVWKSPIKGRKTLKSICRDIEELRKNYGNTFKVEYDYAIYSAKDKKKTLTSDQKKLVEIYKTIEEISPLLWSNISQDSLSEIKFNNPFSLSQLYTLIETDTLGFSSNCVAVNKENNARMQFLSGNCALCSRLPTESVRPFDGAVGKILERQAYEIAKAKSSEIKELDGLNDAVINVGILIEQNKFEYSASLATIKNSKYKKKIQKRAKSGVSRQLEQWKSKEQRIKDASRDLCPYTGEPISELSNGEIDHIIPRSFTKASMGTIFNSEANLIFCSKDGNQTKKENVYTLRDLSPKYLNAVFGTADSVKIKQEIDSTVAILSDKNPRLLFDMMNQREQDCCRHALFMPHSKAYQIVVSALARSYSTRVNGTQSYFVKAIISKLRNELSSWLKTHNSTLNFFAYKVDPSDVHSTRENLSKSNPFLKKQENQPITSHAIDAMCVLSAASNVESISENISENGSIAYLSNLESLEKVLPNQYRIVRIEKKSFFNKDVPESRKLFKDTIYAEHFLTVMSLKDQLKVGFNWNSNDEGNSVEIVKGQKEFLEILAPFFTDKVVIDGSFHAYKIDKIRAFNFIHKYLSHEIDDNQMTKRQYELLNSLHYTTLNTDVSTIYSKNKFKERKEIMKKDNFEIKVKFPSWLKIAGRKSLELPSKHEWESVVSKFEDLLGKKVENGLDIFYERLNLKKKKNSALKHKGTRRVFSLPVISTPSGGIRIRRQSVDNKDVYQIVEANTPESVLFKGFFVHNEKVSWSDYVMLDSYIGKNLTYVGEPVANSDCYVTMDEERLVFKDDSLSIFMSPSSKDRSMIRIVQSFDDFNSCLGGKFKSPLDVPSEITLVTNDSCHDLDNFLSEINKDFIGKPRDGKIKLLSIGNKVCYWYQTSRNKKVKAVFENPLN